MLGSAEAEEGVACHHVVCVSGGETVSCDSMETRSSWSDGYVYRWSKGVG